MPDISALQIHNSFQHSNMNDSAHFNLDDLLLRHDTMKTNDNNNIINLLNYEEENQIVNLKKDIKITEMIQEVVEQIKHKKKMKKNEILDCLSSIHNMYYYLEGKTMDFTKQESQEIVSDI